MKARANLADQIANSIATRRLVLRDQAMLVAVSGGLDSMVLLHVLAGLAVANRWRLTVAHFNHQLRGQSSDADEQLVKRTAEKLRLPFVVGSADVKKFAREQKLSVEMGARKLRHGFLARVAGKRRIPVIALAHHADDQVELFFVRLLRGSGGEGLAGMKWQSPSPADPKIKLVRPLLDQPKSALEQFAKDERIKFREDASNSQLDVQRNRIRRELLPLLKQYYQPALERVILRQMEILGAESDLVGELALAYRNQSRRSRREEALISPFERKKVRDPSRRLLRKIKNSSPVFDELAVAVQRRCLQDQMTALGITPSFDLIEALRKHADRPVTIDDTTEVSRDVAGALRLGDQSKPGFLDAIKAVKFESRAGKATFSKTLIAWMLSPVSAGIFRAPKGHVNYERFDADKVGPAVVLRHWRAGDRFQPIGMAAPVKLQDLFINAKVVRERRHRLLVGATSTGEIFWVEGLRLGERFKLDKKTRYQLHWRWKQVL